jgi:uncharacterized protein YaaR (DUF327 family)
MNVKETMEVLLHWPIEEAILICGDHGIGKSQVIRQVAEMQDIPYVDFRLSQNDVGDLKGMPFHVNGRTIFAPPEFMPLRDEDSAELKALLGLTGEIAKGRYGDKGILFLDEINRATREVQQAAFELVLDRRLNLRALPDGWRVVAAINDDEDIYTVNTMEPAFLSRFYKIDFRPTLQEWLRWADDTGVHKAVTTFIRKNSTFLDPSKEQLQEATAQGVKKVHDRRAWDKLSRTLNKLEADHSAGRRKHSPLEKNQKTLDFLEMAAAGFVGTLAAAQFRSFIETEYEALDAERIINKFDAEVKAFVNRLINENRQVELGAYNDLILDYLKKNVKEKLSKKQGDNLSQYLSMIHNEAIADLWQGWNTVQRAVSEEWYRRSDQNKKIIMGALLSPEMKKRNQAKKESQEA